MCMQLNAAQLREQLSQINTKASLEALISYLQDTGRVVVKGKNCIDVEDDYIDKVKFMMGTILCGDIVYVFNRGLGLAVTDEEDRLVRVYKVNIDTDGKYAIDGYAHSEMIPAKEIIRIRKGTFDVGKILECYRIRHEAYDSIRAATEVLTRLREI